MNGTAAPSESPLKAPENILSMALVTICGKRQREHGPGVYDRGAALLATPRPYGGTKLVIARVLGELKILDLAPTTSIHLGPLCVGARVLGAGRILVTRTRINDRF